jgi:hypothetical protein
MHRDGEKVAEVDGHCSGDVASIMKHRWYPCSKRHVASRVPFIF